MHNIYNYTSALKLDLPCKLKIIMGTQHWLQYIESQIIRKRDWKRQQITCSTYIYRLDAYGQKSFDLNPRFVFNVVAMIAFNLAARNLCYKRRPFRQVSFINSLYQCLVLLLGDTQGKPPLTVFFLDFLLYNSHSVYRNALSLALNLFLLIKHGLVIGLAGRKRPPLDLTKGL